jgi:hypothetical protein
MTLLPRRLRILLVCFGLLLIPLFRSDGRLGETAVQCTNRYGPPKDTQATKIMDKNFPVLEGAIHHVYEYQGWKIRAAFVSPTGPAVRMDYSKVGPDMVIKDYEVDAIMTANTPLGLSWKKIMYHNPDSPNKGLAKLAEGFVGGATGQKMWQRNDGAILWLRSNLSVRLELPAAREYEAQLKATKEQKARASVPQF